MVCEIGAWGDSIRCPQGLPRLSLFIEGVMALSILRRLSRGHALLKVAVFCCAWLKA